MFTQPLPCLSIVVGSTCRVLDGSFGLDSLAGGFGSQSSGPWGPWPSEAVWRARHAVRGGWTTTEKF